MGLFIGYNEKTNEEIELPISTLKRHIVALGASGSGKTVMGKAIIEECVRNEIPVIVIDIQGDLSSLALMGDKKTVEAKGTPGKIYDDYKKKAAVAIFTPVSRKGIPISINPLLAPPKNLDEEEYIQAIDAISNSIVELLGYSLESDTGKLVNDYLYLLLQSIWSKDGTLNDFNDLSKAIANDTEYLDEQQAQLLTEKEKKTLTRRVRSLTIGADSLKFNLGIPLNLDHLMKWAPKGKVPVNIFYLNTLTDERDKHSFIAMIAQETYRWMLKNPSRKVQLIFFLDELAGLVPPYPRNPPTKKFIQLLMKQARKYGVSMMLATQNISDVDYKSLAQVNTWFLGRMMTQQDLGKVKSIIESISPTEADMIIAKLPKLSIGRFMLLSPDNFDSVQPMRVRWLVTDHKTLDDTQVKEIMDESGLREYFKDKEGTSKNIGTPAQSKDTSTEEKEKQKDKNETRGPIEKELKPITSQEIKDTKVIVKRLHETPTIFSIEEADVPEKEKASLERALNDLVKQGKLKKGTYNGQVVYWDPKHDIDPENYLVGPMFRLRIKLTKAKARKRAKDGMKKLLYGLGYTEVIKGQPTLKYMPVWRIPVTIPKVKKFFKTKGGYKTYFYVNAINGSILTKEKENVTFISEYEDIDIYDMKDVFKDVFLEKMEKGKRKDYDVLPKMSREDAVQHMHLTLGIGPDDEELLSLVFFPFWEITLKDKDVNDERKIWIDAIHGTIFDEDPFTKT